MRAREFTESTKRDHYGLHNPQFSGVHVLQGVEQGYEMYRLGLDLAMADGKGSDLGAKDAYPAADKSVVVAYSSGDNDMIAQVLKQRGIKHKDTSKGVGREADGTNTASPVANLNKKRKR
jgi:hypothetical protein